MVLTSNLTPCITIDSSDDGEEDILNENAPEEDLSGPSSSHTKIRSIPPLVASAATSRPLSRLPTPRVVVDEFNDGIVLAVDFDDPFVDVKDVFKFELYSFLSNSDGDLRRWFKLGDLSPNVLPFICELNNIEPNVVHFFAVRAVDRSRHFTDFSPMCFVYTPSRVPESRL